MYNAVLERISSTHVLKYLPFNDLWMSFVFSCRQFVFLRSRSTIRCFSSKKVFREGIPSSPAPSSEICVIATNPSQIHAATQDDDCMDPLNNSISCVSEIQSRSTVMTVSVI